MTTKEDLKATLEAMTDADENTVFFSDTAEIDRMSKLVVTITAPSERNREIEENQKSDELTRVIVGSSSARTNCRIVILEQVADRHLLPPCLIVGCVPREGRTLAEFQQPIDLSWTFINFITKSIQLVYVLKV